jgi:translation elongation factor EF-4
MSVFCQRLEDEYDANVIVTAPTVPYKGMCLWNPPLHILRLSSVVYHDKTTKFVRSGLHP